MTSFLHTVWESVAETLPDARDDGVELAIHQHDEVLDPYMAVEVASRSTEREAGPVEKVRKVRQEKRGFHPERRPEISGMEHRYLPPGTMKEYWEQFRAHDGLGQVSFSLFWRTWKVEFPFLHFRSVSSHAQCSCCLHHRLLMKELSPYIFARQKQSELYSEHLMSQYRDRQAYWAMRASSRLRTLGVITLIQDGMDQAKFMWPRGAALRAKDLATLIRPRLAITGVLAHGWGVLLCISTPEVRKDSSSSAELFLHALTRLSRLGLRLSDTIVNLVADNTSRELKNSTTLRVLTALTQRRASGRQRKLFIDVYCSRAHYQGS